MTTELDKVLAAQLPIVGNRPARKRKPAAKKAVKVAVKKAAPTKKAAAKKAPAKAIKTEGKSKVEIATEIYLTGQKAGKSRKEVLEAFIEYAGLTPAGANTYMANIKKKHG